MNEFEMYQTVYWYLFPILLFRINWVTLPLQTANMGRCRNATAYLRRLAGEREKKKGEKKGRKVAVMGKL